jgi:hypothetical protein
MHPGNSRARGQQFRQHRMGLFTAHGRRRAYPATDEIVASVPSGTVEDVDLAARASADAFDEWSYVVSRPSSRARTPTAPPRKESSELSSSSAATARQTPSPSPTTPHKTSPAASGPQTRHVPASWPPGSAPAASASMARPFTLHRTRRIRRRSLGQHPRRTAHPRVPEPAHHALPGRPRCQGPITAFH